MPRLHFTAVCCFAIAAGGRLQAQLIVTELQSSQSSAPGAKDYWELTNLGATEVSLGGYKWDDSIMNSNDPAAVTIPAGTIIAPGESMVFTLALEADFRTWWNLPAAVKVISSPSGPGLGDDDMVGLFDPAGTLVASFRYGPGAFFTEDGSPSLAGHAGISAGGALGRQAAIWVPTSGSVEPRYTFATGANYGSFQAATGPDSGSPGTTSGQPPENLQVSFSADTTNIAFGKTVLFTVAAANASGTLNYHWDFGDGFTRSTSSSQTAHLYQRSGVFTVRVTATSANGSGTSERSAYITVGEFSDDSDGDGLVDGMEYFFGTGDGDQAAFGNFPRILATPDGTQLRYSRLADSVLGSTLETSTDLLQWNTAIQGLDYEVLSSPFNGKNIDFTYLLSGTGYAPAGKDTEYRVPFTASVKGASLGGLRVENLGMVGTGRISAETLDQFGETLGGSSGLAITDWSFNGSLGFRGTLNMLPDRGVNGSNYAARIHRISFTFKPSPFPSSNGLGQLMLSYRDSTKVSYLDGEKRKFTTGINPFTNTNLFGQLVGTTVAANGPGGTQETLLSFDAEALQLLPDGSGFISDEYGSYIARLNPNKSIVGVTQLPEAARPHAPVGTLNFSAETTPLNGRRDNQGLEGIAVTPDRSRLFALVQSALVQDYTAGAQTRNNARLFVYDISGSRVNTPLLIGEYVVKLPRYRETGNGSSADKTANQSEIVAVGNHHFLMLPQDGSGLGSGLANLGVYKAVQLVDFSSATNVLGLYDHEAGSVSPGGVLRTNIKAAASANVVNLLDPTYHPIFGINTNNGAPNIYTTPEKLEGMALVPDISTSREDDFFLFVGNDNDFQSSQVRMLNGSGVIQNFGDNRAKTNSGRIVNDAVFYVYRLTIGPAGNRFYRMRVEAN